MFRNRPGVSNPVSIILTPNLLILADEALNKILEVKLSVIGTAGPKDVFKVQMEESALYLTIIFKSNNIFSKPKWRLKGESKAIIVRLNEELRRVCITNGNTSI